MGTGVHPADDDADVLKIRMIGHVIRDHFGPCSGPYILVDHLPVRPRLAMLRRAGNTQRNTALAVDDVSAAGAENALLCIRTARFIADKSPARLPPARRRNGAAEQGILELSPALLSPARGQRAVSNATGAQVDRSCPRSGALPRRDVLINAVWPIVYECAEVGFGTRHSPLVGPNTFS